MGIDVPIIYVSSVNDPHVARDFAFDTFVRLALHLSLCFDFFRSFPHIVDRAADNFSFLIFLDMFVNVNLLIAGPEAHGCGLFAS